VQHPVGDRERELFEQSDENEHVIQGNNSFVEGKKSIGKSWIKIKDIEFRSKSETDEREQKLQLVKGRWTALHPVTRVPLSGVKLYEAAKAGLFKDASNKQWMGVSKNPTGTWWVDMKYIQSVVANPIEGLKRTSETISRDEIQLCYPGQLGERALDGLDFLDDGRHLALFVIRGEEDEVKTVRKGSGCFAYNSTVTVPKLVSGRQLETLFSTQA